MKLEETSQPSSITGKVGSQGKGGEGAKILRNLCKPSGRRKHLKRGPGVGSRFLGQQDKGSYPQHTCEHCVNQP